MRWMLVGGLALGLAGCPDETDPNGCDEFDEVFVWVDEDGDNFGGETPRGYTCQPQDDEATNNVDCDDTSATVNPSIEEACDLIDNDCDGATDEALTFYPWYLDGDHDGYGDTTNKQTFCMSPGPDWTQTSGDCDDGDLLISPLALEVCDAGIDNDCDGAADDLDGSLDLSTTTRWYVDGDGDGYGGDVFFDQCLTPNPEAVTGSGDCADNIPSVNPGVLEQCNPDVDENCNGLIDDEDPNIDPAGQLEFFADSDGDGYGDPNVIALACAPFPGVGVDNADDCDDLDFEANVVQDWYIDADLDGVGAGIVVANQCVRPAGGNVEPAANGIDCMPEDPLIFPGQFDPCLDGTDSDCDMLDTCHSCQHWLDTLGVGVATDGVYDLETEPGNFAKVWCDQTTDGGGWTLVNSTKERPPNDAGTPLAVIDQQTLEPVQTHKTIWMGMRRVVEAEGDIRFACKLAGSAVMDVDLSFYDNLWYMEITAGTDAQSCFNEQDGAGQDSPPARRDNLSGSYLPAGDPWNSGVFEGEDTCADLSDFAIDFDDRGMAGNANDGTDWGESNGTFRCTAANLGTAWFVFAREH